MKNNFPFSQNEMLARIKLKRDENLLYTSKTLITNFTLVVDGEKRKQETKGKIVGAMVVIALLSVCCN